MCPSELTQARLPGSGLDWLGKIRADADARFRELGFPKTTHEDWRFTSVEPIAKIDFTPAAADFSGLKASQLDGLALGPADSSRLVFVNGYFSRELSSAPEAGLTLTGLAEALRSSPGELQPYLARKADAQAQAFTALNTASFADGAFVRLPKNAGLEKPIHLLFISTGSGRPTVSHPRVLVVVESGAKAALIEEYVSLGSGSAWTNAVTEIFLAENAKLDHYRLGRENGDVFHISATQVGQARGSVYTSHSVSLGGGLVRNDLSVALEAEGAECTLNGLYMVDGRRHVDNHTLIDHAKPHTSSRELYKGVLDGPSRAVFNGAILVRPDAQKINSVQSNKNLILSEGGLVHSKPEFKIFANDVQCKHGATIGQISPDALFYLRSRGLGLEEARKLLVYAFISEMVDRFALEPLKKSLLAEVR